MFWLAFIEVVSGEFFGICWERSVVIGGWFLFCGWFGWFMVINWFGNVVGLEVKSWL